MDTHKKEMGLILKPQTEGEGAPFVLGSLHSHKEGLVIQCVFRCSSSLKLEEIVESCPLPSMHVP